MSKVLIRDLPERYQKQAKKKLEACGGFSKKKGLRPQAVTASPIQVLLFDRINREWPGRVVENYRFSKERNFELDIAFVDIKVGIEVDGWQYHGKFKEGFQRDRIKDRLATLEGWSVLRFFYAEIKSEMESKVIRDIRSLVISKGLEDIAS